jgi:hypothetical protein
MNNSRPGVELRSEVSVAFPRGHGEGYIGEIVGMSGRNRVAFLCAANWVVILLVVNMRHLVLFLVH